PLCGLEDSQKELAFVCGLEGCKPENVDAVEALILQTLEKVAAEGVPQSDLDAALHQLELQQREVGGDGYPYGLQLVMTALTAATHRGDPIALLDVDAALASLRKQVQEPDFIQRLVKALLLDNPHRVRLAMHPDSQMNARKLAAEKQRLAAIKASLSEEQKQRIIERTRALEARQQQKDDESILPKVTLADVPADLHYIAGSHEEVNRYPLRRFTTGTNGLVYQQVTIKLPHLDEELLPLLPYYSICLTELGIGDKDYLAVQRWQAEVVGSISAYSTVRGQSDDVQAIDAYITLSSKALARNHNAMDELLNATLR